LGEIRGKQQKELAEQRLLIDGLKKTRLSAEFDRRRLSIKIKCRRR